VQYVYACSCNVIMIIPCSTIVLMAVVVICVSVLKVHVAPLL